VKTRRRIERFGAILLAAGIPLTASVPAIGQDVNVVEIEEMIVSSRARDESLQDVPISVSVVTGDVIDEAGIANLRDASSMVPNFTVGEDPIGDKINIRGIVTNSNASLEQSVLTVIDGVNRARGTMARLNFLDLERLEVLRGPQGTLFGKNTVGGALSLVTRKPTTSLSANFNAGYELELEETSVGGFISGPLSDTVRARFAYSGSKQDKGYIKNRFFNNTAPTSEDNAMRGTVDWDVGAKTLLRVRTDYTKFDHNAEPYTLRTLGPLAPFLAPYGITRDTVTENAIGQTRGGPLEVGSQAALNGDSLEVASTLLHQFDAGELEVIGAVSKLNFFRKQDSDYSPLEFIGLTDEEDYKQKSLSVRFVSNEEGRLRYVGGLYYQQSDLALEGVTSLNTPVVQTLAGAGCMAAGFSALDAQQIFLATSGGPATALNAVGQLQRAPNAAAINACTLYGASLVAGLPLSRVNQMEQDAQTGAIYTQADYDLTPKLELTVGLRYTYEMKDARQAVYGSSFGTNTPDPTVTLPLAVFLESTPHEFGRDQLDRSESKLTYSSSLQWKITDSLLTYVSTSSGFKAGGFNVLAVGPDPAEAEFEPEEVTSYELGAKTRFYDNRAQLNAALFFTKIDNLQITQFTGNSSFVVQNAATAETQGLELDARFKATENLELTAAASYTDFNFTSFPNPACTVDQVGALRQSAFDQGAALIATGSPALAAQGYVTQLLGSNQSQRECTAAGINNLQGRTTVDVPKFTTQFGVDYHMEIGQFGVDALADVEWNDKQYHTTDLNEAHASDAFTKTNVALTFYKVNVPWKVMLVGRNIFDETTFSGSSDVPLLVGSRQSLIDKPRTVKVQLTYDF